MCNRPNPLHCLIPPFLLDRLSNSDHQELRDIALDNAKSASVLRTMRSMTPAQHRFATAYLMPNLKTRRVYDMSSTTPDPTNLPGKPVREEGDPPVADDAVNEAFEGAGATYDFYKFVMGRDSIDNQGMPIISTVHAGQRFDNAFWNGQQMVYGDGDGMTFKRFTLSLEIMAHELTHGVIAYECNLRYQGQAGSLNEHFADVFGSMVKQWHRGQTVEQADWLIGSELMEPSPTRRGVRDLANPGTAFKGDPILGDDPQKPHMDGLFRGIDDYGGVHLNSGIPNRAFYLAAKALGGYSWDHIGKIWYGAMRSLAKDSQFADMASTTRALGLAYQGNPAAGPAIDTAWKEVGL